MVALLLNEEILITFNTSFKTSLKASKSSIK